jgi:hypothetical protein
VMPLAVALREVEIAFDRQHHRHAVDDAAFLRSPFSCSSSQA